GPDFERKLRDAHMPRRAYVASRSTTSELPMDLENKTIIVTGASSGIGAAAAVVLARAGANLVLGARREEELVAVATRERLEGGRASPLRGSFTEPDDADALVALATAEFGGLDGALNNVGIVGDMVYTPEMSIDNWNKVIATNLTSAFFAAKAQIPALVERGRGALVFTSSFVGVSNGGLAGMGAYAASKAGLVGLVK